MTTQQKISAILKQDNYKVSDGKVLRYDQLEDKFKPVIVSGNRIPLVKTGSVVEIFTWDDVAACIEGMNGAAKKNINTAENVTGTIFVGDKVAVFKDGKCETSDPEIIHSLTSIAKSRGWGKRTKSPLKVKVKKDKKPIETKSPLKSKAKKSKPIKPSKKAAKKPKNPDRTLLSKEDKEFIKKEARNPKGMTINQLAKKFNASRWTIGFHFRKVRVTKTVVTFK